MKKIYEIPSIDMIDTAAEEYLEGGGMFVGSEGAESGGDGDDAASKQRGSGYKHEDLGWDY